MQERRSKIRKNILNISQNILQHRGASIFIALFIVLVIGASFSTIHSRSDVSLLDQPNVPSSHTLNSEADAATVAVVSSSEAPTQNGTSTNTTASSKDTSQTKPKTNDSSAPSQGSTSTKSTSANNSSAAPAKETPEQAYLREYKNLGNAYYSLSAPQRTESGGYINYTVTMTATAFNDATFGNPTLFAQLTPSTPNRYSCATPSGTMATFVYGPGKHSISITCQVRACPECYYPGGPLPYYGAFSIEVGGITTNGVPTGKGSQSYDLQPGYDKPL